MSALNLHRNFARSEFKSDLFVKHAGNHQTHHLALARGQRLIALLQFGKLPLLVARDPVAIEGLLNSVQQILIDEWLGQELHRARFDGFHCHRNIAMSGNKDDGDAHAGVCQFPLKFQAVYSRKGNV